MYNIISKFKIILIYHDVYIDNEYVVTNEALLRQMSLKWQQLNGKPTH